jgi:hypothetical protein
LGYTRFLVAAAAALCLAAGLAVMPVGAGSPLVDFLDLTPQGSQPGLVHALQSAADCTGCHGGLAHEHHYPGNGWSGSMKANAARDPLFWAALDVANRDGEEAGVPGMGDFCLRCHSPQGWYGGRVLKRQDVEPVNGQVPADQLVDGAEGCRLDGSPETGGDYDGVACHFCHRKQAQGPHGQPGMIDNARIWLDDGDCGGQGEPCRAGPYAYPVELPPDRGGGEFTAPHPWEQRHFLGSAEACGSCHDVSSPTTDQGPFRTLIVPNGTASGQDTGLPFPIERTYSEWLASDFSRVLFRDDMESRSAPQRAAHPARGANCRDCHMPQAQPQPEPEPEPFDATPDLRACFFGPNRLGELPTHEFAGGNTWVPAILKGEYPGLGRDEAFDWTIARATAMLSERSAQLYTEASLAADGTRLDVDVQVVNLSGHKLPTGYGEGRRMWLALEVRDAEGGLVWSDGDWDAATGELSISDRDRVYEIKQGIWDASSGNCRTTDAKGREAFHFVLNDCVAKDNRIPPAGFAGGANPELRSVGRVYPETAPGSGKRVNHDRQHYQVPLPQGVALPLAVRASLRYQTASKAYIEFLRDQAQERGFLPENTLCADGPGRPFSVGPQDRSRGQYVYELWNDPRYGRSPPVTMAQGEVSIQP